MTKKGKLTFVFVTLLLIVALAGSVMAASADALKYDGKYYSDFEDHDEALVFGRQAVRLYIIEERREQS